MKTYENHEAGANRSQGSQGSLFKDQLTVRKGHLLSAKVKHLQRAALASHGQGILVATTTARIGALAKEFQ